MAVTNTNIFATATLTVTQSEADGILVTHNGEIPIHSDQWSGASMPLVLIPTASGTPLLDRAPTSVSASLVDLPADADGQVTLNPVTADPCFKTLGYAMGSLSSYLPSSSGTTTIDECGDVYTQPVHRTAAVTLSAQMVYGGVTVSDTAPFTLHAFDRPYNFRKENESFDMTNEFGRWDFLESVGQGILAPGEGGAVSLGDILNGFVGDGSSVDDVGTRFFEKIANFVDNTHNVDRAELRSLYSIADKLDHPMEDFGIAYPPELLQLMDVTSIPQYELFGVDDCWVYNIGQPACGHIAHTNLGDQLPFATHIVSAGDIMFFNRPHDDNYQTFHVVPDESDNDAYPLSAIQSNAFVGGADTYCFFDYVSGGTGERVGAYIDFDSPFTTIDPQFPVSAWNEDGGAIDLLFEHKLREGLGTNA